jgi:hypothetical protein
MMPVVLVIIIAVAWIVILGPNLVKRHSRSVDGIGSISHFHRQLRVLEHSAPQPIVTPAYRLRALDGPADSRGPVDAGLQPAPVLTVVGASQLPRPALAFLGEDPVQPTHGPLAQSYRASALGPADRRGSRSGAMVLTTPAGDSPARRLARRRRRDTLAILTLVFVGTGLIGIAPGAGLAWMVTAVSGTALVGYVALLVHLRRMAEERERKLHYLRPGHQDGPPDVSVVRVPRMSGRYAHPSNQAALAH